MSSPVRNAGSDIQDTGSDRRKSFQCCGHGNGGTSLIIMKYFSGYTYPDRRRRTSYQSEKPDCIYLWAGSEDL